jgi:hypothetical protein
MLYPMTQFVYARMAGEAVLIPERSEEWVVNNYGPHWNEPAKGWNFWASPYNHIIEEEIPSLTEKQSKTMKRLILIVSSTRRIR